MAHDRRLAYLNDIVSAIGLIESFCSGKTVETFKSDLLFRSAVERQLTIIGEAVTKLLQCAPEIEKSISAARQIVGFRNQLIHNYGSLDTDVVWTVIVQDLAPLKQESESLIRGIEK
jgi:uncharacterized protein with HEPN domain